MRSQKKHSRKLAMCAEDRVQSPIFGLLAS
jgi:hypothetical protein